MTDRPIPDPVREAKDRIILALDLPTEREALEWAGRFRGRVGLFKIGLQLFTAAGPGLVARIAQEFGPVFLDLKLHDIPNTVALAVRSIAGLGVSMTTLHASGGQAMLRAASQAASEAAANTPSSLATPEGRMRLLAVTVLTSLGPAEIAAGGVARSLEEQVIALSECAWLSGCDGVVASPLEVGSIRTSLGRDPLIVTPGIRSENAPPDDQARTALPREALEAGADYLVIGRPILLAQDPLGALERILASIG